MAKFVLKCVLNQSRLKSNRKNTEWKLIIMGNAYLWTKTLHIVLIASWFAGLFYLPRIFVNLADEKNPEVYARLLGMANRLFRFMTILAVQQSC
jgi:uncharacterized membrane protein